MWNTIVARADSLSGQMQSGISEAIASRPLMIVAGAALGSAFILTGFAETQTRQLNVVRVLAESERLIRAGTVSAAISWTVPWSPLTLKIGSHHGLSAEINHDTTRFPLDDSRSWARGASPMHTRSRPSSFAA